MDVKCYFQDSIERPRYPANAEFFNENLVLYKEPANNDSFINYSIPIFSTSYRKVQQQQQEYQEQQFLKKFTVFRCPREYASCFENGYPDYSNPNTVWITSYKSPLTAALKKMLWYISVSTMPGSYISLDKFAYMELCPVTIVKSHQESDQETLFSEFVGEVQKKDDHKEVVVKVFKRAGAVDKISKHTPEEKKKRKEKKSSEPDVQVNKKGVPLGLLEKELNVALQVHNGNGNNNNNNNVPSSPNNLVVVDEEKKDKKIVPLGNKIINEIKKSPVIMLSSTPAATSSTDTSAEDTENDSDSSSSSDSDDVSSDSNNSMESVLNNSEG